MSDYIKCSELTDFIADYLTGALSEEQRREFERHLKVCPPCIAYLDSYRTTLHAERVAHQAAPDESPPAMPEDLVKAILAARDLGR